MRLVAAHSVMIGLVLTGALGALGWMGGSPAPALQTVLVLLGDTLAPVGQARIPALPIALGAGALALALMVTRRSWRQRQQALYLSTWRQAEQLARETILQEVRMLEHAHLKSAVIEAQALLDRAINASDADQRALLLHEVDRSLQRLRRLVVELHGAVARAVGTGQAASALPLNLERTLVEVCKNFRRLVPRCTLEVAGRPVTVIPQDVQIALEMGLYNALSNAYRHGRAQMVHVRLQYGLHAITLSVRDDGCGFDVEQARHHGRGRGLADLARLARQQDGAVTITSAIGRGTEVTIAIPLKRPALGWAARNESTDTTPSDPREGAHYANDVPEATLEPDVVTAAGATTRPPVRPGGGRHGDGARPHLRPAQPPWVHHPGR